MGGAYSGNNGVAGWLKMVLSIRWMNLVSNEEAGSKRFTSQKNTGCDSASMTAVILEEWFAGEMAAV